MCRNIRTLFNFEPPATEQEARDAALQFVRKIAGSTKPSRANEAAFDRAVAEVTTSVLAMLATLQTTALVHELYLRLVGSFRPADDGRRRFFGAAAKVMRRILVDRARERLAEKRGGGVRPQSLDTPGGDAEAVVGTPRSVEAQAAEALAVDAALVALERHDPRLAELVELRFFAGFSVEESAELLGSSPRTVKRDWQKARALLADWLGAGA